MQNKFYPWLAVALLWLVALLNYTDRQMLSTMRPSMQEDIVELQSAANFGYLMAIFLWIYAFTSPLSGFIADRFGKKWIVVGSLFVWSAVTYAMVYATTFDQLYWLRALMGLSEALYMPAALALIAGLHPAKTRSLAVGIHLTGVYVGQGVGGFGATISHYYSWTFAFQLLGGIGVVYAMVLLFVLKDDTTQESVAVHGRTATTENLKNLLSNRSFWILVLYFAAPSLPGWAIKNWLPTLFSMDQGIDMSVAGPVTTVAIAASSLVGVVAGGALSDRWVLLNSRGRMYTSAVGLGLTIPALVIIGGGISFSAGIFAAFLFGLGFGIYDANNMPILCQLVSVNQRATGYGIMNMVGIASGALITGVLGTSTDEGSLGRDIALLAGVVLLIIVLQLGLLRPRDAT